MTAARSPVALAGMLCAATFALAACAPATPPRVAQTPAATYRAADTPAATHRPAPASSGTASSLSSALPSSSTLSPTASLFPLERYDQDVDRWIDPHGPDIDRPVLSAAQQAAAVVQLKTRYFGAPAAPRPRAHPAHPANPAASRLGRETGHVAAGMPEIPTPSADAAASPWEPEVIAHLLDPDTGIDLAARVTATVNRFGAASAQPGFGRNLRPYAPAWIEAVRRNAQAAQFTGQRNYLPGNRAITTTTGALRLLPTSEPFFYDPRLPGEGYPFDNLEQTALRPATPLYILGRSRDGGWLYVLAPDVAGWIRSDSVGRVDARFVAQWRAAAWHALGAVTGAAVSVTDRTGVFRFAAPIGTVLPLVAEHGATRTVMTPVLDADHRAQWRLADLPASDVAAIPLAATPANFAMLLRRLQSRPYAWGGSEIYNDCSLELKSLFTPFGVWLPRHSSEQVRGADVVDLPTATPAARIAALREHGRPLLSVIDIGGHVMLYLGNGMVDGRTVPIVYEDVWGLSPADGSRRAILGQSVILPLLEHFPEDTGLASQADRPRFRFGSVPAAQ